MFPKKLYSDCMNFQKIQFLQAEDHGNSRHRSVGFPKEKEKYYSEHEQSSKYEYFY
jgi:hypothetical protein